MFEKVFLPMKKRATACCKRDKPKNHCSEGDKQEDRHGMTGRHCHRTALAMEPCCHREAEGRGDPARPGPIL
jgi:hypothetical protein